MSEQERPARLTPGMLAEYGRLDVMWQSLVADLDAAKRENRRLWALLHTGAWHRDADGRTHLAIRVADGADLSCKATREDAINAALAGTPEGK